MLAPGYFIARRLELETSLNARRSELEAAVKTAGEKAGEKLIIERAELADRMAVMQDLTNKVAMIQEKTNRLHAETEILRKMHGKSIRGLLKRNPKAVSYRHTEAFADLKQSIAQKLDAMKITGNKEKIAQEDENSAGK